MMVDTAANILLCRVIYLMTGMTTGFYAGYIVARWISKKVRGAPRSNDNNNKQQQLTEIAIQS